MRPLAGSGAARAGSRAAWAGSAAAKAGRLAARELRRYSPGITAVRPGNSGAIPGNYRAIPKEHGFRERRKRAVSDSLQRATAAIYVVYMERKCGIMAESIAVITAETGSIQMNGKRTGWIVAAGVMLLACAAANAADGDFVWAGAMSGTSAWDSGSAISVDGEGNVL